MPRRRLPAPAGLGPRRPPAQSAIHTKTGVQLIDCTWAGDPALAATLWYAATGTWPHDYRAAGIVSGLDVPGPEIRRLVVHGAAAQEGE
ncbi:hypothetical protein [Streptomyces sp. NPDC058583]|uniref:hypothetical protein n=1 Tax=unclassified Streptomyces TaxID=2593676 RepID=UPI00364B75FB